MSSACIPAGEVIKEFLDLNKESKVELVLVDQNEKVLVAFKSVSIFYRAQFTLLLTYFSFTDHVSPE